MKILHVLSSNKFSGAENVACQIIQMFSSDNNVEMAYCSPYGTIEKSLTEKNIKFYPLKKLSLKQLRLVLKEFGPDIIHAHDMKASFLVSLVCKKIKLISHIHNNSYNSRKFSLKSILYFFAAKKAEHIIWVSQSAMNGYIFYEKVKNKSTVLYNVIDICSLYEKVKEDKNNYNYDIVFIGRLTYPKNPQRLIKILKQTLKINSELKAAIIGTGELEGEIKNLLYESEIEKNINLLGFISNPYKILANSKAMLFTSRWEGTPMAALEALALGVPIISTPTDGLCELIKNGENGYLTDEDNEFTDYILKITSDRDLRERLSVNALTNSQQINNVENYKSVLCKIYNESLVCSK